MTTQKIDDLDTQKEKPDQALNFIPDSLSEFIRKEAVIFALITAISYLVTYEFQSSYLKYFGVDEIFVDLELSKIIVAAAGVIILSISIYQFASMLPLTALHRLLEIILIFPLTFFPIVLLALSISVSGFSYTSQAVAAYLLIVGPWTWVTLRRKLRKGTQWREIVQESLNKEREVRSQFLGPTFVDSRYGGVFILAIVVFFNASLLGNWAGKRAASKASDFMVLDFQNVEIAIIGTFKDQFIGVAIEQNYQGTSLTGNMFLVSPPPSGDNFPMQTIHTKIHEFEHPDRDSLKWVTFGEAWRRNFDSIHNWIGDGD